MIVACATDRRFVPLAGAMLSSLFANGDVDGWRIIVFGYRLRPIDKARLRESCGADGERLEFIDVDPRTALFRPLMPNRFASSPAPYIRLMIPALLEGVTDRLLYIDADALVLSSLRPLATLDLDGCVLAAAIDQEANHPAVDGRLLLPREEPYFNSGVLVLDLERWRSLDLTRVAFEFAREHADRLRFADQDVLNCILVGKRKELDPAWNFIHHRVVEAGGYSGARILHFTGAKPWSVDCDHPAQTLFLEYRSRTPWRNKRLYSRFERRASKMLHKRSRVLRRWWMRMMPKGLRNPSDRQPV